MHISATSRCITDTSALAQSRVRYSDDDALSLQMMDVTPPRNRVWTSQSEAAIGEAALAQALSETQFPGFVHVRDVHVLPAKGRATTRDEVREFSYLREETPHILDGLGDAADAIKCINSNLRVTVDTLKLGLEMDYAHFGVSPCTSRTLLLHRCCPLSDVVM